MLVKTVLVLDNGPDAGKPVQSIAFDKKGTPAHALPLRCVYLLYIYAPLLKHIAFSFFFPFSSLLFFFFLLPPPF